MNTMRENGSRNATSLLQMSGILSKKSLAPHSGKWTKRFFLLKDGFLFYYVDSEKKEFERRQTFNTHPKGVIPLGQCSVDAVTEPGHPFSFKIKTDKMNLTVVAATQSEFERNEWITAVTFSSRITWHNVRLCDDIIHQYEVQGLQMAHEKQHYFDKLQLETSALQDEKQRTEELERVKGELEKEKNKMEVLAEEMREEQERIKLELEETNELMKSVGDVKKSLHETTQQLQSTLEDLERDKQKTIQELSAQQEETTKLSVEKQQLSVATRSLKQNLRAIEERTNKLLSEKSNAEQRLLENEERSQLLEEEKKAMRDHSVELQTYIKELSAQNAITENELKVEVVARLEAERRLREADVSLARLDRSIRSPAVNGNTDERRDEMIGDVNTLKRFFENLALEAKMEDNPAVMKTTAIHVRQSMVRRAKTMRYQSTLRKSRTKAISNEAGEGPMNPSRPSSKRCRIQRPSLPSGDEMSVGDLSRFPQVTVL